MLDQRKANDQDGFGHLESQAVRRHSDPNNFPGGFDSLRANDSSDDFAQHSRASDAPLGGHSFVSRDWNTRNQAKEMLSRHPYPLINSIM